MSDGGIGLSPKTAVSVSLQPSKFMEYPPNAAFLSFAIRYPPFGTVALPSRGAPRGAPVRLPLSKLLASGRRKKHNILTRALRGYQGLAVAPGAASVASSGIGGRACPRLLLRDERGAD